MEELLTRANIVTVHVPNTLLSSIAIRPPSNSYRIWAQG